jgi:hypothetical protein
MPTRSKKSEGKGKGKAVAGTDEDFDDMLAELRAADITPEAATSSGPSASSSDRSASSSSSSSSSTSTSSSSIANQASAATAEEVSEEALVQACARGDLSQLRRWARRGVRVTSAKPLCYAVKHGKYEVALFLVRNLGADVNQADAKGFAPLFIATHAGNLRMVKCLAIELGADVNQTDAEDCTPLYIAACLGHLGVVQCLVEELGVDVNLADEDGNTPLMVAANRMHHKLVRYLLKHGADPQASHDRLGTAADLSRLSGAPVEQTAYIEARTHCANPGCTNAGLKKCERCLQSYFCGSACIRAHWPAHKAECTAAATKLNSTGGTPSSASSSSSSSS